MQIQEVENIVGLSKKSIRYYESIGLLNPKRKDNKYREYNEVDINKLKIIKFLRELDVPIKELLLLNDNEITLKECMHDRINKIKELTTNYEKIKLLCEDIITNNETFDNININRYFQDIRVLNKKERFTMNKTKGNNFSKISGAVIASVIFSSFFIFLIGMLIYFQMTESMKCPTFLFIFLIGILLILTIGIGCNLITRIKEILGGEEDEASKY